MKFESWQIFHVATKALGPGFLQNLYSRSVRLIYAWGANPRHCEVVERNPIDRIRMLLDALDNAGYGDMSRMAIDYMSAPLGGRFCDKTAAKSAAGDVNAEAADLSVAMGELIRIVRAAKGDGAISAAERIRIREAQRTLKREIEELLDAAGIG